MTNSLEGITDISSKENVKRLAVAKGTLILNKKSISLIRQGGISKGDVREASTIAAIQAVKETPRMIPHCHNIPIEGCNVEWEIDGNKLNCTVTVKTNWKTGVEMEALCGVSSGLLCAWDMLKSNEKDQDGQYPETKIIDIRVLEKIKDRPHD